jgi:simple sugar transport system ATP-binding protein
MIELRDIHKVFPAGKFQALGGASLTLRPSEIHALLGENGAGKSTFMHILAGYLRPSGGSILLDGKERRFAAPADALKAGIGMVRQRPALVRGSFLWEDCVLGKEPRRGPFLDRKKARALVDESSRRWGFGLSPDQKTETLTVSQRQKAAILSLLLREARCLIFDEPTAALSPGETEGLFGIFKLLAARGKAVVLISHKLEETLALAGQVTILRRGKTAASLPASSLDPEKAGALMFGLGENPIRAHPALRAGPGYPLQVLPAPRRGSGLSASIRSSSVCREELYLLGAGAPGVIPCAVPAEHSAPILSVRGLRVEAPGRPPLRGINLECLPGRITGIAGVRDAGLETLELALTGFLPPSGGSILLRGREIRGVRAFREAGGAYLNADSYRGASAPALPLWDSLVIHAAGRSPGGLWGKLGLLDRPSLDRWAAGILREAGFSLSPRRRGDSLSGGMLQRLILAREFAEEAPFLALAEPGRGLDRQSREALHEKLRDYARGGRGVLLFSTDVEELISRSEEVHVLKDGEFSASFPAGPSGDPRLLREQIGRAMAGLPGTGGGGFG